MSHYPSTISFTPLLRADDKSLMNFLLGGAVSPGGTKTGNPILASGGLVLIG
jgi:hypothetical protein